MEVGDLVAYEFVTPNGDWSWSIGSVEDCSRNCLIDISQWTDSSSGKLHGKNATDYFESLRDAEESDQAAKRLVDEVRAMRTQIMQQRAEAEENERRARERLLAAQEDVRLINAGDIREMRSYRTPPTLVKETLAAVLCLLRQSPVPETWENVQRVIRNANFINNVLTLDPQNEDADLNRTVMSHYLSNPAMTVENVNLASKAAGPLLKWLFAKIGATAATVELKAFDREVHNASVQLKRKSERIAILQQKAAASQKRAADLRDSAMQSNLSFRKVPGERRNEEGKTETENVWSKDTSASSRLTILTTSILCNFGHEQGNKRVLSTDEQNMITEAHETARRDNSERLNFALESLAAREKEFQQLEERLAATEAQTDSLETSFREEKQRADRFVQIANDEAAASERIQIAYREEAAHAKASQQRVRALEQTCRDMQTQLDTLAQTLQEQTDLHAHDRASFETQRSELKELLVDATNAHSELQHAYEVLQANLSTVKEVSAEEVRSLSLERDASNIECATLQHHLETERETCRQLRTTIEQDHVGYTDDVVRRETSWLANKKSLESHIVVLEKRIEELEDRNAHASRTHEETAVANQQTFQELQDRLLHQAHALEDTQSALSLAEAQNLRLSAQLEEQERDQLHESKANKASLEELMQIRSDLEARLESEERASAEASKAAAMLKQRMSEAHAAFELELSESHAAHAASEATCQEQSAQLNAALSAAQAEMDAAAAKSAELEAKCNELSSLLATSERHLAEAREAHSSTSEEQYAVQRRLSTVGSELQKTHAEFEAATRELDELREQHQKTSSALESERAHCAKLAFEMANVSHTLSTVQVELSTTTVELNEIREVHGATERKLSTVAATLEQRDSELDNVSAELQKTRAALSVTATELSTAQEQVSERNAAVSDMARKLELEQGAHEETRKLLEDTETTLQEKLDEVARVSRELNVLQGTQGATSADLQRALDERETLSHRLHTTSAELAVCDKALQAAQEEISALQDQARATAGELAVAKDAHKACHEEVVALTRERDALQDSHNSTNQDLSVVRSEHAQKHSDFERVTDEATQLRAMHSDVRGQLDAAVKDLSEKTTALERAQKEVKDAHDANQRTQRDLDHTRAELAQRVADAEQAFVQRRALQNSHDDATAALQRLQANHDSLVKDLESRTSDLAATKKALHSTSDENGQELLRLRSEIQRRDDVISSLKNDMEQARSRENQLNIRNDLTTAEKALSLRELEALEARHRIELSSLQSQVDSLKSAAMQKEDADSEADARSAADRARELEEMQSRLERELQYSQSVHTNIVAQHVQLERELRSHVDGLMKETEQLRSHLRSSEQKQNETQERLDNAKDAVRGLTIKAAAAEEQVAKVLQALQISEQQAADLEHQVALLTDACQKADDHAAELAAMSENQRRAIEVLDGAQEAAEAMDEERRAELEALMFERDELLERLHAAAVAKEAQDTLLERRVHDEQLAQRDLQREVDALSEKLMDSNRSRVENSQELALAVERLQQEKRDAIDDLTRQLEATSAAQEDERRKVRLLTMERDTLALATQHKDGEIQELQHVRQQEVHDRQQRLEELVNLHREQLSALRKERDAVIRDLHTEELSRSDMEFQLAEVQSRLARYEPLNSDGTPIPSSVEQSQIEELRSRFNKLQRDMDRDSQLLREKDSQLRDMSRRVGEYELLTAEQDQRRSEAAEALRERDVSLREREQVLERERLMRVERDRVHRTEMEELQRRVVTLEANSEADTRSASRRKSVEVAQPPASKPRDSPAPLNPASLHRHNQSNNWQPLGSHNTPSVITSNSRRDPNADLVTGAHLVVMIRKVADLQHNGKPFKANEVYAKLKTIKEKHRSTIKPIRNLTADFDEQFVFHLAHPAQDVVHVSIVARTPGSLFDNEVHIGDVDISMATLSKGAPRTRTYTLVQDARTKKARPSGLVEIVLRTDDFGSPTTPSAATVASEEMRYQAMFQTALTEHPEYLHAIEVYMAGEGAAIEEAKKKVR